jgi:HEAT repeat protein
MGAVTQTRWPVGNRQAHDFALEVHLVTREGQATPAPSLVVALRGDYLTTVVGERDGLAIVRVEIHPTQFDLPDVVSAADREHIEQSITEPVVVTYDRRGKAHDLYGSKSGASLARALQRELVSTFQFSVPGSPLQRWTAVELDPVGECEVAYVLQQDGRYVRRKTRYVRVATAEGLLPADRVSVVPKLEVSVATYALDGNGRILQLSSRNLITASPSMSTSSFATEVVARFNIRSEQFDPTLALEDPFAGLIKLGLTADREAFREAEHQALRQFIDDATAEQLIEQIAAEDKGQGDIQARLAALIRLDSSAVAQVDTATREGYGDAHLLGALGAAGTPEAQQALIALAADASLPLHVQQAAIEALHAVDEPTADTMAALELLTNVENDEIKKSASYALGALAGKLAATDEAQASAYVQKIVAQFEAAQSDGERMRLLDALGNAGRPEGLESIAQGLTSADSVVRDIAARALRKIDAPQADAMLSDLLLSEAEADVREAALFAAGFRRFSPLAAALSAILQREPESHLRGQAVGLLATYLQRDGDLEVVPLLKWVAANDPDTMLRQNAARVLSRTSAP